MKKKIYITFIVVGIVISYGFKDDWFEISKQIEIFTNLYKELNINYVDEVSSEKLLNSAIESMLSNLDPFTNYYNEQDLISGEIEHSRNYFGIGAEVSLRKRKIIVTAVHKSYPADVAGLKPGDEIVEIDGTKVPDFEGNSLELLKGEKGSKLTLVYLRQNQKSKPITLTRDDKVVKTVPFYGKVNLDVGYIVLTQFDLKASENVREALEALKKDGIKSVILDLRNNPGGLLNEAVEMVNLFVSKNQLVVTTKSKTKANDKIYTTKKPAFDSIIPVAVIINGRSASASEIVSGAFQDLDRGVIIGKTSYGKGLVQKHIDLPYGAKMKLTISRYYTSSGRCIQALDYSQKTIDGKGKRIEKTYYDEYKTKNGRVIYDKGGISPDVDMGTDSEKVYTKQLVENAIIFDFATNYYYRNPKIDSHTFALKKKDFEDFKQYVLNDTNETELAKDIKNNMESSHMFLGQDLKLKLDDFLKSLKKNDIDMIEAYKVDITKTIEDEIIKRYLYEREYYFHKMTHDPEIQKAVEILSNSKKYREILHVK